MTDGTNRTYEELCKDITASPIEREIALLEEYSKALRSLDFYRLRCERLQEHQGLLRDPERKIVCDILANGRLK